MSTILDEVGPNALERYLTLVARFHQFDVGQARVLAAAAVRYYSGDIYARDSLRAGQALEERWYASLAGEPDFSVYDDDFFIGDIWACWIVYSRKYVRMFKKIAAAFDVSSVVDLGCGFGYTTAVFKEMFPLADVYGTQLESSFQFQAATSVGAERGFTILPAIDRQVDLVFASEYFEHFSRPIEHLNDVLRTAHPKFIVTANSFGARSIGHFNVYLNLERRHIDEVEHSVDSRYSNKRIGREFNGTLRGHGYEQLNTGFWNNRPNVWRRVNQ